MKAKHWTNIFSNGVPDKDSAKRTLIKTHNTHESDQTSDRVSGKLVVLNRKIIKKGLFLKYQNK